MLKLENQVLNLSDIKSLVSILCSEITLGDVIMLQGELGVGKTTFSRFIINELYFKNNIKKPNLISSPTYPILLTYDLSSFEIYHYDLYRIKDQKELRELDIFENIKNSITLIEWPELLIDLPFTDNHYFIRLDLHSEDKRIVNLKYIKKN